MHFQYVEQSWTHETTTYAFPWLTPFFRAGWRPSLGTIKIDKTWLQTIMFSKIKKLPENIHGGGCISGPANFVADFCYFRQWFRLGISGKKFNIWAPAAIPRPTMQQKKWCLFDVWSWWWQKIRWFPKRMDFGPKTAFLAQNSAFFYAWRMSHVTCSKEPRVNTKNI